jgi:hypothetical protein
LVRRPAQPEGEIILGIVLLFIPMGELLPRVMESTQIVFVGHG